MSTLSPRGAPPALFAKLGVLLIDEFLTPDECAALRAEMRAAPRTDARLRMEKRGDVLDHERRKSLLVDVSATSVAAVLDRLRPLKSRLEAFFGLSLGQVVESPRFLIYRPGDFFFPHRDVRDAPGGMLSSRRVNVIICLNDEAETPGPDEYAGTALTLYGLIGAARWNDYGFPVRGVAGRLVAYRADVLHEVPPIVQGERYVVVARFLDPSYRPDAPQVDTARLHP